MGIESHKWSDEELVFSSCSSDEIDLEVVGYIDCYGHECYVSINKQDAIEIAKHFNVYATKEGALTHE
jgi:hypothetical protein